jgi:uncharacterized membrane protein YfcA
VDGLLTAAFFLAALLYSSVGHGGASAYLAVMSLAGFSPAAMRPTALVLNLIVAGIGTARFARAGLFSWPAFWPLALGSMPFAFVGGAVTLPARTYRILIGVVLLAAAFRLLVRLTPSPVTRPPSRGLSLLVGGLLGLLAGLTGTGGGIFLSPLALLLGWAGTRETAALSAAFILANSAAGLAGNPSSIAAVPDGWWRWALAALAGGLTGSALGARRISVVWLRRLLGLVLALAGLKLLVT